MLDRPGLDSKYALSGNCFFFEKPNACFGFLKERRWLLRALSVSGFLQCKSKAVEDQVDQYQGCLIQNASQILFKQQGKRDSVNRC